MSRPKIQGSGFTLLVTQIPILTIVSNLNSQLMKMRFAIKNGFYYIYSKSSVSAKNLKFSNWDLRFEILRRFLHPSSISHLPLAFSFILHFILYFILHFRFLLFCLFVVLTIIHQPSYIFSNIPRPLHPWRGSTSLLYSPPSWGRKPLRLSLLH